MKDAVQRLVRAKYGFTPVKGDIRIGTELSFGDIRARTVKVGDMELIVRFEVQCELVDLDKQPD